MDAETVQAAHLQNSPKPQVSKYYFKKKTSSHSNRNGKDGANHDSRIQPGSPLSKQSLTFYDTPTYHAGAFYEIDHDKLPPKSPIHLKSIRVVKVSRRKSQEPAPRASPCCPPLAAGRTKSQEQRSQLVTSEAQIQHAQDVRTHEAADRTRAIFRFNFCIARHKASLPGAGAAGEQQHSSSFSSTRMQEV